MSIHVGLLFLFPNMEFYLLPQLKYYLFFRLRITKLLKSIVKLFFSFFPPGTSRYRRPYNLYLTRKRTKSYLSALKTMLYTESNDLLSCIDVSRYAKRNNTFGRRMSYVYIINNRQI